MISVYMISQNNFYQNWTSEIYPSEIAAISTPKSFYKGTDVRTFLNESLENPTNQEIREELCIMGLETLPEAVGAPAFIPESTTEWPESTTGIAVIAVAVFLLVALMFCLICCLCVCCLREEKEKE